MNAEEYLVEQCKELTEKVNSKDLIIASLQEELKDKDFEVYGKNVNVFCIQNRSAYNYNAILKKRKKNPDLVKEVSDELDSYISVDELVKTKEFMELKEDGYSYPVGSMESVYAEYIFKFKCEKGKTKLFLVNPNESPHFEEIDNDKYFLNETDAFECLVNKVKEEVHDYLNSAYPTKFYEEQNKDDNN